MPHRSVITIHWDERTPQVVAENVAALVAEEAVDHVSALSAHDSDVSVTLWEDDD